MEFAEEMEAFRRHMAEMRQRIIADYEVSVALCAQERDEQLERHDAQLEAKCAKALAGYKRTRREKEARDRKMAEAKAKEEYRELHRFRGTLPNELLEIMATLPGGGGLYFVNKHMWRRGHTVTNPRSHLKLTAYIIMHHRAPRLTKTKILGKARALFDKQFVARKNNKLTQICMYDVVFGNFLSTEDALAVQDVRRYEKNCVPPPKLGLAAVFLNHHPKVAPVFVGEGRVNYTIIPD